MKEVCYPTDINHHSKLPIPPIYYYEHPPTSLTWPLMHSPSPAALSSAPPRQTGVKTRFAPSPTGRLHLGGLRTALFAYLYARRHQGQFYLRIEDTDTERFDPQASADIIRSLTWAGLTWEPEVLYQSQRLELYQKYAHELVASGHAYRCFCSKERLDSLRTQQTSRGAMGYDRACRDLNPAKLDAYLEDATSYVIRVKMPLDGSITVTDGTLGRVTYPAQQLNDAIILKSNGYPTYHLAHIVDDHLTQISHVLRGQEWLSTLPLHHMIWQSLQWPMPQYYHLPLITSPDGGKLSKRSHSVSVAAYIKQGYLPAGLINFLVLLGWSYDDTRNLFNLTELGELFDLTGLSKSHAMFSEAKLKHLNNHYIQRLSPPEYHELAQAINPHLYKNSRLSHAKLKQLHLLYQSRLNTLSELSDYTQFVHQDTLDYAAALKESVASFSPAELSLRLQLLRQLLTTLAPWEAATLKTQLKALAKAEQLKMFDVLMPLRIAAVGALESPSILELCEIMGQSTIVERLDKLLITLEQSSA